MRRIVLSAIASATWLPGAAAALSLAARGELQPETLTACAAIAAACLAGNGLIGWIADRHAARQARAEAVDLAGVLAALPFPAALFDAEETLRAASPAWTGLAQADWAAPHVAGRHRVEIEGRPYVSHVTTLPSGGAVHALVRSGAVIPGPALERFAQALIVDGGAAFRFEAKAISAAPALAAFNQILEIVQARTEPTAQVEATRAQASGPSFTQSQRERVDNGANDAATEPVPAVGPDAAHGDGSRVDANEIPLSDKEFARIRDKVQQLAGIALSDAKRTLVVSRLSKIVRGHGLTRFSDYLDQLERAGSAVDAQAFVNALTTNLTRFYREDHHFDHLVDHVGALMARRPRVAPNGRPRLRIWSAGCSTGQEPYTIAVALLAAYPELARWDFRILATDIDSDVLARAARGQYPASELNGLAPERVRLFERSADGGVAIPAKARDLVTFRPLNLMVPSWPFKGPFDAIFCRNVAIYFDKPTQGALFDRLGKALAPDGFLYIGHSENLTAVSKGFRLVGKTVYQLKDARSAGSQRDAA